MVFSFGKRKKQLGAGAQIDRLINLTTPNRPVAENQRAGQRYNRTFPVLLNPWSDQQVVLDDTKIAFTRDLSEGGIGVISLSEPIYKQFVLTAWPCPNEMPEPYYFLSEVREVKALSLGLWIVGFEATGVLQSSGGHGVEHLQEIAEQSLLPATLEPIGY